MHHGTPESCSVCLLPCMFLSAFITGCLLRFFFLLFAFILTIFLLFIYLFAFCHLRSWSSSFPISPSIFQFSVMEKNHLNLSLHLFITCHLQLLPFSTSLSLSPPLHLFMCVPNNLFTHQTPPSSDLSVLGQCCSSVPTLCKSKLWE